MLQRGGAGKGGAMRKLFTLVFTIFLAGASLAQAGPDRFSVLLGSKHIGASGFNEINPGFFATWERERFGYTVGAFLNSYERGAVSATIHTPFWSWEGGALGGFAGLAWYPEDGRTIETHLGGDIIAIGGLELRHRNVFVQFLPMGQGSADGVVSLGLTWDVPPGGAF